MKKFLALILALMMAVSLMPTAGAAQGGSYIWFGDDRMTIPKENPDICYHIPPTLEQAGILRVEYVAPEDNSHNNQQPALRLVVKPYESGDELYWRQAYENGELPGGWLGFTVGIKAPQNSTGYGARSTGNGPFLEQAPLRTDFSGLELEQSQWTGGSLPIGSINVSGDRVQVVLSKMGDSNVLCASYWQPQSGETPIQSFIYADTCIGVSGDEEDAYRVTFGKDVSAQRPVSKWVEMRYSHESYNGILNEEVLTTTYDNRTNTITVMPKEGINPSTVSFGGNDLMILTPPKGYTFNGMDYSRGNPSGVYPITGGSNDGKYYLYWGQGSYKNVSGLTSMTIKWWNEETDDVRKEDINLRFLSRGIAVDYNDFSGAKDWAPMGTRSGAAYGGLDVDKLKSQFANSGIVLDYNQASGYFHISYDGSKIPSAEAMMTELQMQAPVDAVYYRETNMTGTAFNWMSAAEQQFNMNGREYSLNADRIVTYPVTLYNTIKVPGADVYYTAMADEWMHLIQWLDKDKKVISTEYICGMAESAFFEEVTQAQQSITEVDAPTIILDDSDIGEAANVELVTRQYPQEGNGLYLQMEVKMDGVTQFSFQNGDSFAVLIPWGMLGVGYNEVESNPNQFKIIHYLDDDHRNSEPIDFTMEEQGIYFNTTSFSPFAINRVVAGDIDQYGSVDKDDLTLLMRHLANIKTLTSEQLALADVDGVSGVSSADAVVLARMIKNQGK